MVDVDHLWAISMRLYWLLAALIVLTAGCATEDAYNSWEPARTQNCKERFSPHDPQLEYCLEQATRPYDEYEKQRDGTDKQSEDSTN